MRLAIAVLGLSLFLSAAPLPAHADAKNDLAAKLAAKVMPRETWDQMMAAIWDAQAPMFERMLEGKPEAGKKIAAIFKDRFSKALPYQEMVDLQAGLLAKYYSPEELKSLIAFYDSPVGRKTLAVMPKITADAAAWSQQRMMNELPTLMQDLEQQVRAELEAGSK